MSTPFDTPDWRNMSDHDWDLGLNNGVAVQGSADLVAGWDTRSAEMRARYPGHLDLRYGRRERNRIDFLKVADGAPTLLFIHGGYWQTRAKETFAVFAGGPMAHGINVALIGYTLAPDATLDEIVAEIAQGLDLLTAQLPNWAAIPIKSWRRAGPRADISLRWRCRTRSVKAGMAISGIYDLEPIRHSYLNVKLGLDETMTQRNSPMMQAGGALKPLSLVVGGAELPLLRKQTADFAGHRAK